MEKTRGEVELERARALLEPGKRDELRECDRQLLLEFDQELKRQNRKNQIKKSGRIAQIITNCRLIAEHTHLLKESLEDGETGERAVDDIVEHLTAGDRYEGTSIETKLTSYKQFARAFNDDLPERFEDITPWSYRDDDFAPKRNEVIWWDEVMQLVEAVHKPRDKALIATSWSSMARPQKELSRLQFKDVTDNGDHMILSLPQEAKTGSRDVYIFAGAPLLRHWMYHEHPAHQECEDGPDPETFVWTHHNKNVKLKYSGLIKLFKRAQQRSGLEKNVTPKMMRKSRASYLAKQPMISEKDLRFYGGWAFGSVAPKHYIHRFDHSTAENISNADGAEFEVEDNREPIAPVECHECEKRTERGLDHCIWCGGEVEHNGEWSNVSKGGVTKNAKLLEHIEAGRVDVDALEAMELLEDHIRTGDEFFDQLPFLISYAEGHDPGDDSQVSAMTPVGAAGWLGERTSNLVSRYVRGKHRIMAAHPRFEQYPMGQGRTAALLSGLGVFIPAYSQVFLPEFTGNLLSGNPATILQFVLAMVIVGLFVHYDLPDRQDVVEELSN